MNGKGAAMRYQRDFTIGYREAREFYRMSTLRRGAKGILGISLVAALAAILYMPEETRANGAAMTAFCVTVALLTAVLLTLALLFRTDHRLKKSVEKQWGGSYRQEVTLDAFGVHVTVDKKTAKVAYDKIVRVKETKKAFYVFITPEDGWILPKNQMEHPAEDSRAIRKLLHTVMIDSTLRLKKD